MARLNRNILANISGQAWSMVLSLIFIPVYIHTLGVESYGLIGVYVMLLGLAQVFDMGLGATINRELSRRHHVPEDGRDLRTLVRTAERIYALVGILLAGLLLLAAGPLAGGWINIGELDRADVRHVVALMAILLGLQWPLALYQNVLMGMQEQVTSNLIYSTYATLGNIAAALAVVTMKTGVEAYFITFAIIACIQLIHLRTVCWRKLGPRTDADPFRLDALKKSMGFTAGMAGITIMSVLLIQLDKVLLSRLLSLGDFGLYVLAGTMSRALYVIITPIFNAVFPRLSSELSRGNVEAALKVYHSSAQLMAVLVLSAASAMAIFSHDIYLLWIGSATVAQSVAPVAAILAFGTAMTGLMNVPYAMQLAKGSTGVPFLTAALIAILVVPGMIWAAGRYGSAGAAWTWFSLNLLYLIVGVAYTHLRIVPGQFRRWLFRDLGLPLLGILVASAGVAWVHSLLVLGTVGKILSVVSGSAVILAAAVIFAQDIRVWVVDRLNLWMQPGSKAA